MRQILIGYPVQINTHPGYHGPDALMNLPAEWMLPLLEEQHPKFYQKAKEILDRVVPHFEVMRDLLLSKEFPAEMAKDVAHQETYGLYGSYKYPESMYEHLLLTFEASVGNEPDADYYPYLRFHEQIPILFEKSFWKRCRHNAGTQAVYCIHSADHAFLKQLIMEREEQERLDKAEKKKIRRQAVAIAKAFTAEYLSKGGVCRKS